MTIPLNDVPLAEHDTVYAALERAGFTDLWSSEVAGADAFTPLALAAAWAPRLRLGTAITPVFTRGPGLLAMSAAALAEAAPGRFSLGIGASSPVLSQDWNAVPHDRAVPPHPRHAALPAGARCAGRLVDETYETFAVRRFRLERPPAVPPPVLLAALRPRMLRLAAEEADGVILNWLGADDVPQAIAELGSRRPGFEIVARIFVCPTENAEYARTLGRRLIATYLTVPAYAAFHRWLGREKALDPMWRAWAAGDRRGAAAAVPDEVVDALVLHGSPADCRDQVRRYAAAGVDVPVMALLPTPESQSGSTAAMTALIARLGTGPAEGD